MPQFFFDTTGGGGSVSDNHGLPFATSREARAHALTLLPVMDVELPITPGEFRSWTVTVRDDADDVVCRFIMAILNDDLSPGAGRILSPGLRPGQ